MFQSDFFQYLEDIHLSSAKSLYFFKCAEFLMECHARFMFLHEDTLHFAKFSKYQYIDSYYNNNFPFFYYYLIFNAF